MAKSKAKKLKEEYEQARLLSEEINGLYNEAKQTISNMNSITSEANVKLTSISSIVNTANENLIGVEGAVDNIQEIKEEIAELKSSLDKMIEKSKKLAEEIEVQLGTAAGGSLSHTFNDRKKELEESKNNWRKWFLLNIVALFIVALIVFLELKSSSGFTTIFWLKITLAFPFIYSAIFFHSQFNKDREYVEEYAFKSAVALSLQAYKELFENEIDSEKPTEQEKLLEFISNTTKQIYTSPREIISIHPNKEDSVEISILDKLIEVFKKLKNI